MGNILNKINHLQNEIMVQANQDNKNSKVSNMQNFNDLFIYELQLRNEISSMLANLSIEELEQVKSLVSSFDIL